MRTAFGSDERAAAVDRVSTKFEAAVFRVDSLVPAIEPVLSSTMAISRLFTARTTSEWAPTVSGPPPSMSLTSGVIVTVAEASTVLPSSTNWAVFSLVWETPSGWRSARSGPATGRPPPW